MAKVTLANLRTNGRVSYFLSDGSEVGREWFSLHRHGQCRFARAMCEMDDDALIRDSAWSLDADWRPIEGYVRVVLDGKIVGSTSYVFDGQSVSCHAQTAHYGSVTQVRSSNQPYEFLGLHPLLCDGMLAAVRGKDRPGEERMINGITCSYSQNGATDLLALPILIGITYDGDERLLVRAGEFEAHRFSIRWRPEWPAATYWVWGDDYIFLKSTWDLSALVCELVSVETASRRH